MFRFKKFTVIQENNAMKVGTDSVLLGSICSVDKAERVLDIGTGTGLLALMIAQRNESAHIDAIEIDSVSAKEAQYNVQNSRFRDNITVINSSIQDFIKQNK